MTKGRLWLSLIHSVTATLRCVRMAPCCLEWICGRQQERETGESAEGSRKPGWQRAGDADDYRRQRGASLRPQLTRREPRKGRERLFSFPCPFHCWQEPVRYDSQSSRYCIPDMGWSCSS